MNSQISPVQIVLPIAMLAGLAIAFFFGLNIARENYTQMALLAIGFCVLTWAIVGRKIWWLPIFLFVYLGGHFFLGFKIYAHELAVMLCLLPLIITLAMKRDFFKDRHFGIPVPVLLLFIYLFLHFLTCFIDNKVNGLGGLGNVSRRYMDAIWPFLIFLPFLLVGNTKYIPWVLHLIAGATLIRFCLGMYSVYRGVDSDVLFIPGINFVPAGGYGASDLRGSGTTLVTVALCYFCIYRSFLIRLALLPIIAAGTWGTFLGGGRITIVLLLGLFGYVFLIYKNYGLLLTWAATLLVGFIYINSTPETLYKMPETARRAASAFLIDRGLAADASGAGLSDQWHMRLMKEGFKSWTEDGMTILFGRGVKPFEDRAWGGGKDFEGMIEMATQTSRFEKALWDVLCTFGLVGLLLYSILLLQIIVYCTPILLNEKIKTPVHAIMFIAVYQSLTWFLLCWISGSFPSSQILIGIVAMVAAHDMMRKRRADEEERASQRKLSLTPDPANLVGTPMK